jgi:hypothetical protein
MYKGTELNKPTYNGDIEIDHNDAKLMEAAPIMYELLKECSSELTGVSAGADFDHATLNKLDAFIASINEFISDLGVE